jgi:GTP pyrophosphokinase
MYEADIRIYVFDRMGILADISVALADMKVYILQINTLKDSNDNDIVNLKVSCKNIEHYRSIVSRLKSIKGVVDVIRGFS